MTKAMFLNGQVTLAAGMTDDTIGWILLSVVSGLASSGKFDQNLYSSRKQPRKGNPQVCPNQ
ncbi:hypothetical protein [Nostoc sp. WHI]|uniref:hypothetical protein n=1 Tax=Nostoc sp. WHI TaxID=2650611 RepID=UPI0018C749A1|nr:hypothetical protein [Nostoc sp. WHI]